MVYLSRIYTKTGDDGTTGLGDGQRVAKDSPRIEAYGTVDETGAVLGVVATLCDDPGFLEAIRRVQNDLFDVGADLCIPWREDEAAGTALRVSDLQVERLEREIDAWNVTLPPLRSFILSGGHPLAAQLHVARCTARRAERWIVTLRRSEPVNPAALRYMNRLSDYLFVAARFINSKHSSEVLWQPGANR